MQKELLDYFKVMLVSDGTSKVINYKFMTKGILLNFIPNEEQTNAIKAYVRDANVSTMFSVDDVNNMSTDEKIVKQISHYALQFGTFYTFDVMRATDNSDTMTITLIRGVTKAELQLLIDDSLYSNRPVKDSKILAAIIKYFKLAYDVNKIKNNELRVILFDAVKDRFNYGDDAVRYIVNACSESDLLIKSLDVIKAVQANADNLPTKFLTNHKTPLSEVYNRHKRIIMAVKVGTKARASKSAINQIARLSKNNHKPIVLPMNKTFISDALISTGGQFSALGKIKTKYDYKNLDKFALRDKLKILSLLEFKTHGSATDIFVIRNGRVHLSEDRPVYAKSELQYAMDRVLQSIAKDLAYLKDKVIVLPKDIDYGLPISRKQSVGNLPYGTKVNVASREISSGVYWKNDWGARDIDLSAVDRDGNRTGWGSRLGYDRGGTTGVQFSGDIVNAPNGAMEFLTSSQEDYGLFANIFNGEMGCKIQILVGKKDRKDWIEETFIREEVALKSRGNIVGFVRGKEFTLFYGRMNESYVSSARNKVMIQKALSMRWTIKTLFDHLGIAYVEAAEKPDYDLSYAGFSFDKLENLLNA